MFAILVYDVGQKRVGKVCKYLRTTLRWMQNSVFEGEVTDAGLARIIQRLKTMINRKEDSVLIYQLSDEKWLKREELGVKKGFSDNLL